MDRVARSFQFMSNQAIAVNLNINPADVEVLAEYLNAQRAGECTSAQHEAIAQQTLGRIVGQAAIKASLETEAIARVIQSEYDHFSRSHRRPHLPRAKRTVI
jgi:hypothetical protein